MRGGGTMRITQDILKKTTEYRVRNYRRRRWQKIVSALASVVVFCTVYALILPAITWNNNSTLTINGKGVKSSYTWSDGAGIFDLQVDFVGSIDFDGRVSSDAEPYLRIDVNNDDDTESFTKYIIDRDALPYATFRLHLWLDRDTELDISSCNANISITVDKQKIAAATPIRASYSDVLEGDAAAIYGEYALSEIEAMLLEVTDGKKDLAAIEMSTNESVLAFSQNAAQIFAVVGDTTNPTYTLQHYVNMPQVKIYDRLNEGWSDNQAGLLNRWKSTLDILKKRQDRVIPFSNFNNSDPNNVDGRHTWSAIHTQNGVTRLPFILTQLKRVSGAEGAKGSFYEFETVYNHVQLFRDINDMTYRTSPQIGYMSLLYNNFDDADFNKNYTLSEIWVYQPPENGTAKPTSQLVEGDFVKYAVPEVNAGTYNRHDPSKIRFTNNPSNPYIKFDANGKPVKTNDSSYPYEYTILIKEGTVIRFVHDRTQSEYVREANLFDYDIGDGKVYGSNNLNSQIAYPTLAAQRTGNNLYYMYTYKQGINNPGNYGNTSGKSIYAFGNTGGGVGYDGSSYNNYSGGVFQLLDNRYRINGYNNYGFEGETYQIVKGLIPATDTDLPNVIWNDQIAAPDLFSKYDSNTADASKRVIGKTAYTDGQYSLKFAREGGSYTLSAVVNNNTNTNVVSSLDKFQIVYNSGKYIYSNEFWPMDGSPSHGTPGHDILFGLSSASGNRKYIHPNNGGVLAQTDIGTVDHNSFFGMSYYIDFTIVPGYCAPLDYWFYGDDDMWVFLSELDKDGKPTGKNIKLVADIGGVHSSLGQYVNLWDYIEPIAYGGKSKSYRLIVFFTERGASGSSCYMRFTVPMSIRDQDPPERSEALVIEKQLVDEDGKEILAEKKWLGGADGVNSGTWQSNTGNKTGSFRYNVSLVDDMYEFEMSYSGKLSKALPDGNQTNFRIWFHSALNAANATQKYYNSFVDLIYDGSTLTPQYAVNQATDANSAYRYTLGVLPPGSSFEYYIPDTKDAAYVKFRIPKGSIPNTVGDQLEAVFTVMNDGNSLHSDDAGAPWTEWNFTGTTLLPTEPAVPTEPDPALEELRNREFVFLLRMMADDDNYTVYQDLYYYEKYNRSITPDHTKATPDEILESGAIGDKLDDGYFLFTLRADEYIVILNLPPETTYSVAEVGLNNFNGITPDTIIVDRGVIYRVVRDANGNVIARTAFSEIQTGLENYVTSYQEGLHSHDDNGIAVDFLEETQNYSRIAGQWPPIKLATHNYVRYINGPSLKTEIAPGEDVNVKVGDELIYELDWAVDTDDYETVIVRDVLHPGLDFVGIVFDSEANLQKNEKNQLVPTKWYTEIGADGVVYRSSDGKKIVRYDDATHSVICEISGIDYETDFESMFLKVVVNETAMTGYDEVNNKATLEVGDSVITTNTVRNPLWKPVKTEEQPGENLTVLPGDRVVYRVSWKNYKLNTAEVLIKDYLDPYVSFDIADSTVYILVTDENGNEHYETVQTVDPFYDPTKHYAQWSLGAMDAQSEGYVELTVTVKNEALSRDKIVNQGSVTVGNDDEMFTNIVENPLYRQILPSTGGSGTLTFTICGLAVMAVSLIAGCVLRYKRREEANLVR